MKRKMKYTLLVSLILFLILNIVVIVMFKDNWAYDFVKYCGVQCFDKDTTSLLISTNMFMPYDPIGPKLVAFLRGLFLLMVVFSSSYLVYKERTIKNILYFCVSVFIAYVGMFHNLDTASPGIYDFFRMVKTVYSLGVVDFPWILYYLVILLPTILITIIVIRDIMNSLNTDK